MGKLIIDGNSFFEIDEECIKKKRITSKCDLDKYLKNERKTENVRKNDVEHNPYGIPTEFPRS